MIDYFTCMRKAFPVPVKLSPVTSLNRSYSFPTFNTPAFEKNWKVNESDMDWYWKGRECGIKKEQKHNLAHCSCRQHWHEDFLICNRYCLLCQIIMSILPVKCFCSLWARIHVREDALSQQLVLHRSHTLDPHATKDYIHWSLHAPTHIRGTFSSLSETEKKNYKAISNAFC